jgi:hypothetical protein
MQMGFDDANTKCLDRVLIVAMALLFNEKSWRDLLYVIEHIKQGITKELREYKRADNQAKLARGQRAYLWRIGYRALFQALRRDVKDGVGSLCDKLCPILAIEQTSEFRADITTDVTFQQLHTTA